MNFKRAYLILVSVLISIAFSGCGRQTGFLIQPVPTDQSLKETEIDRDEGSFISDKIAVVDVDGVMVNRSSSQILGDADNTVSLFIEKLDKARKDKNVKAVVLRLNSPGGSVAASDAMYHALLDFKQKCKKPVVVCMLDVCASGGYYLACGADYVIAQPSTVTGSIGTIIQTISFEGTMNKLGIKAVAIKSGQLKDLASPLHDLSEEEKKVLEEITIKFYEHFLDVVQKGRGQITREKLRQLADGRVFTADTALKEGLIDKIGYPADAVKVAKERAQVTKSRVVIYHRPLGYKPNIYGTQAGCVSPTGALVNIELPDWLSWQGVQFLYLWQPGI